MIFRSVIFYLLFSMVTSAQLIADFVTTEGNFSVELDYVNAPLTCANFVLLAGKGDDVWESPSGAASITSSLYTSTGESDAARLNLNVRFVPPPVDAPVSEGRYDIYQQNTFLGSVGVFETNGAFRDITGAGRFELRKLTADPNKYQIKFIYRRPWIDQRTQTVKEAPMFKNMPITRVERGKRFFSGSFSNNAFDHPGYQFQDEVLRVPENASNPYTTVFNNAWILAMDSTGTNTNGSRFFITAAANPSWNGKYTPFGVVMTQNLGRQVVLNLANENSDANGVPAREMKILSISFRRIGAAAAFFESFHQDRLPGVITSLPLSFSKSGGGLSLVTPERPGSQTIIYLSTDLKTFTSGGLLNQSPFVTGPTLTNLSSLLNTSPRYFFKGFATALPNWPSSEIDFKGVRYFFRLNSGGSAGTLSMTFDPSGVLASYVVNTTAQQFVLGGSPITRTASGTGMVSMSYSSNPGPYKGKMTLTVLSGPLDVDEIMLNFEAVSVIGTSGAVRSFSAIDSSTGPLFYGYSGLYQRQN